MKRKLILYLINKLSVLFDYLRLEKLATIKMKSNVFIHNNFVLGDYGEITINGICKELSIAENVSTRKYCSFLVYPEATLILNKNIFFNNSCSVNCLGLIEIGENTIFGEGVKIYDHNHKYSYKENMLIIEKSDFTIGTVKIGKNCWIGSNVTILKNVEIGDNVIIGANNLIYNSIASNSIVKAQTNAIIS